MKFPVKLVSMDDGSALLPLPDEIIKEFNIKEGASFDLTKHPNGTIILKPINKNIDLDNLLDVINEENLHDEIDFGEPQGREEL